MCVSMNSTDLKKLYELSEFVTETFETRIVVFRNVLLEKNDPFTGGGFSTAISSSQQGIASGIQTATGIPIIGQVIGAVVGLGGKELVSYIEKNQAKKEADALNHIVFETRDKNILDDYKIKLVGICYDLYTSFEMQFEGLTSKSGGETKAMFKISKYIVDTMLRCIVLNGGLDLEDALKYLIEKKDFFDKIHTKVSFTKLTTFDVNVIWKNDDKTEEWSLRKLLTKTGIRVEDGDEVRYYTNKDLKPLKYGYRNSFDFENDFSNYQRVDDVVSYKYVLNREDKQKHVEDIMQCICKRDSKRFEERIKEIIEDSKNDMLTIQEQIKKIDEKLLFIIERDIQLRIKFNEAQSDRDDKHKTTIELLTDQSKQIDIIKSGVEIIGQIQTSSLITKLFICHLPPLIQSFVGRTCELSDIKWAHVDDRIVYIHGGKGVGKTALAIDYAYKYKHHNVSNVLWINSESNMSLIKAFEEIYIDIGNSPKHKTNTTILHETITYFSNKNTLFIFDNASVDNVIVKNIQNFIQAESPILISIIITSRFRIENESFTYINLPCFARNDSIEYVKTILSTEVPNKIDLNDDVCNKLSEFHSDLPLALNEAVKEIIKKNILTKNYSVNDYLNEFGTNKELVVLPDQDVVPSRQNDDVSLENKLQSLLEAETKTMARGLANRGAGYSKIVNVKISQEIEKFFN